MVDPLLPCANDPPPEPTSPPVSTPDGSQGAASPPPTDAGIRASPPVILEAEAAFLRDLPQLLTERQGQWVAYEGAKRLGFGNTKSALVHDCWRQGYAEFFIRRIQP
jgi:hypothetical protein